MAMCAANCTRAAFAKGLCLMHYKRLRKTGTTDARPPARRPLLERFTEKVDIKGPDECWPWKGATRDKGYGAINLDGRRAVGAHRVAYELHVGPIPAGMWVLHRCDNPPCCNPAHLFLGDALANVRDMDAKGRRVNGVKARGPRADTSRAPRGEQHPQAKLTRQQVEEIRASTASLSVAAKQYGIAKKTVSCIRRGITWKNS